MSYDQFDQYASWLPECNGIYPAPIREPEPVQDYTPQPRHLFDGHTSPSATINPAPRQSIPSWDESTRELRIVLHRHPTTPAFMQDALKTARKTYGQIKAVAVFVQRGMGDSQSITVLRSMNFTKDEARGTGQGVCYVRDMRKQEPAPPKPEPKPEPEPLGWLEQELKITTDAIEDRRQMGVHESFLTGLLSEKADLQKMVDSQNSVKDTEEYQELCRQERELDREIAELKNRVKKEVYE